MKETATELVGFNFLKISLASVLRVSAFVTANTLAIGVACGILLEAGDTMSVGLPLASVASLSIVACWIKFGLGLSLRELGLFSTRRSVGWLVTFGSVVGICWTAVTAESPSGIWFKIAAAPGKYLLMLPLTPIGMSSIAINPIWEELLTRGVIMSVLRARDGVFLAVVGQATIATLMHFRIPGLVPLEAVIFTFAMACLFGLLFEVTGSLHSGIACHVAINWLGHISLLS